MIRYILSYRTCGRFFAWINRVDNLPLAFLDDLQLAGRDGAGVRLITRHGNDFTARLPLAASAVAALPARSCLIDGEAIVCDENGLAVFELIRGFLGPLSGR